jgi:D-serine dehydratase
VVTYFIPLFILGFLVLLLGIFAFLARWRGGQYMRPIVQFLAKVPLFRRLMQKASTAALERQNPELASAIKKMERAGATRDPQRAQQALNRLAPSERRAYLDAVEEQGAMPTPINREQRRRLEKARKQTKRGR